MKCEKREFCLYSYLFIYYYRLSINSICDIEILKKNDALIFNIYNI